MSTKQTVVTVQSLSNRHLAAHVAKRLAPGLIAVAGTVVTLALAVTLGPDALHALAGSVG